MNKIQLIREAYAESRSANQRPVNLKFNERTLIGRNPVGIFKKRRKEHNRNNIKCNKNFIFYVKHVSYTIIQGTLVLKLTVKMGANWKTRFFRNLAHIGVKVDYKNYNQHFSKHDEDNNSQFSESKIRNEVLFKLKPLPFSRQCQVFHFRTYPEFVSLSRFRDKPHFPVFEYNLLCISYTINHWK